LLANRNSTLDPGSGCEHVIDREVGRRGALVELALPDRSCIDERGDAIDPRDRTE
jgi:hypothetical protein